MKLFNESAKPVIGKEKRKVIRKGKGENREYCDRVIGEVLERWDETIYGKTTNREGEEEHEVD